VDALVAGAPLDDVDGTQDAHLQIDRRLLHGGSPVGGTDNPDRLQEIEAGAGKPHDDSLRCR
jgi:hypothetical protein